LNSLALPAPRGISDHDPARAVGVAEVAQRLRKSAARFGHTRLGDDQAVTQDQAVVLIGLQQLLAASLAAHHEETAVGNQFGRCGRAALRARTACVESLHELAHLADPRAAAVQQGNEARDPLGLFAQGIEVLCLHDLQRDQVRMVGQEAQQVELLEQADECVRPWRRPGDGPGAGS
jgi:hypothetical protein